MGGGRKTSREPSAASTGATAKAAKPEDAPLLDASETEPQAPWGTAEAFRAAPTDAAFAKILAAKPKAQATLPQLNATVKGLWWTHDGVTAQPAKALHEDMAAVVKWKLTRGHFRPGLYEKFRANDAAACKTALLGAIAAVEAPDGWQYYRLAGGGKKSFVVGGPTPVAGAVRLPSPNALFAGVRSLSTLTAIGPATATALLALVVPREPGQGTAASPRKGATVGTGCCAFMSDEAITGAGLPLQYTDAVCRRFLQRTTALLVRLRTENGVTDATLRGVGEALWARGVTGGKK